MTVDIVLASKTDWIAIQNNGGRNSVKTAEFLEKANKAGSFAHVRFGDGSVTYAIKPEHIVGFQDWAYEHGLNASFT